MNLLKNSQIEPKSRETRKKFAFFFKILLLLGIIFLKVTIPEDFRFIHSILKGGLFFLPLSILISITRFIILYLYGKRKNRRNFKDNFILGINQISSLLSTLFVFIAVLITFEVNAQEFYTSISIFAVALVLIFKDYISNTLNGMVLMFSNQLALSDYVKIGNHTGQVVNINLKNVILCDDKDALIYIPNTIVFNSDLVNYTKEKNGKINIEFDVSEIDPSSATNIGHFIFSELESYDEYIDFSVSSVRISKIHKDGVLFSAEIAVEGRVFGTPVEKDIISAVNYAVLKFSAKSDTLKSTG